ncbi:MAG: hypothetical protein JW797_19365 [Bradymonadales bacterium]|nr:hypothetical protein [Bradymonadales bacterium]
MAETKGLRQYQVEAQKRGQKTILNLWVSLIRGPRGQKKLLGEAYTTNPDHPMIYFRVVNAETEDEVYQEFLRLLVHRAYLPLRFRQLENNRYGEWGSCDCTGIEDIERVMELEGLKGGSSASSL